MEEIDIWRTAGSLVSRHGGEGAALTAAMRADALLDQGDMEGFNAWKDGIYSRVEPVNLSPDSYADTWVWPDGYFVPD